MQTDGVEDQDLSRPGVAAETIPPGLRVLGIETSCDETGVAVYDTHRGLLAHGLFSQVELHAAYGGVVPELASRDHIRRLPLLIRQTLEQAGCSLEQVDAIAYTAGPGLAGALLVGSAVACAMAWALGKPAVPVHHLEGHLLSPLLGADPLAYPFVALLVSGGHTQFMAVREAGNYQLLGESVDDAAGEAFDKAAQLLGLPYPGGPALSRLAQGGNPSRFELPRPMLYSGDLQMSFSGLKTALALAAARCQPEDFADLAAGFEQAVSDVLCHKAEQAMRQTGLTRLVVAGGVGANMRLRTELTRRLGEVGCQVGFPPPQLCTDNGAMIAYAGAQRLLYQRARNKSASAQQPPGRAGLPEVEGIAAVLGGRAALQGGFSVFPRWDLELYAGMPDE